VIELHWTRDDVLDQIDMPFLAALRRAWADCPPQRRMVAAYLGIKPAQSNQSRNNLEELAAMFPGTVTKRKRNG
jgi:hypothetical protein